MKERTCWSAGLIVTFVLALAAAVYAEPAVVDCSKKSLADAVREASDKNSIITFTGICNGPVVVTIDGLTLKGVGTAIIDGGGVDALTLVGTSRVSLMDFEVTNGLTGIAIRDGAMLTSVAVTGNGSVVTIDDDVSVTINSSTFTGNLVGIFG